MDMNNLKKEMTGTELTTREPDVVIPKSDVTVMDSKDDPALSSSGGVAVTARDVAAKVTVGTGDIHNNKSVGEGMQVSGGTVNMTVNNDCSKPAPKASRFNKLPDAPAMPAAEADKSESLSM